MLKILKGARRTKRVRVRRARTRRTRAHILKVKTRKRDRQKNRGGVGNVNSTSEEFQSTLYDHQRKLNELPETEYLTPPDYMKVSYRDICDDDNFNKQKEGICYAYAVSTLLIKGLLHDPNIRKKYKTEINILYNRIKNFEGIYAADLAGIKAEVHHHKYIIDPNKHIPWKKQVNIADDCIPLFKDEVWTLSKKIGKHFKDLREDDYELTVNKFNEGRYAHLILAAILLLAAPEDSGLVFCKNLECIVFQKNKEDKKHYLRIFMKNNSIDGKNGNIYWEYLANRADPTHNKYCIVQSIYDNDNIITGSNELKFGFDCSIPNSTYYNLTNLFSKIELELLNKYDLLPHLVGGFIMFFSLRVAHVISFIVCQGKLVVCDGHNNKCIGVYKSPYWFNSNSYIRYHIYYVFTPSNIVNPGVLKSEKRDRPFQFEFKKETDYEYYKNDLMLMVSEDLLNDVLVELKHDRKSDDSDNPKLGKIMEVTRIPSNTGTMRYALVQMVNPTSTAYRMEWINFKDCEYVPYEKRMFELKYQFPKLTSYENERPSPPNFSESYDAISKMSNARNQGLTEDEINERRLASIESISKRSNTRNQGFTEDQKKERRLASIENISKRLNARNQGITAEQKHERGVAAQKSIMQRVLKKNKGVDSKY